MCFRPPSVKKPLKCPSCGTLNPGVLTACKKCGQKLESENKSNPVEKPDED